MAALQVHESVAIVHVGSPAQAEEEIARVPFGMKVVAVVPKREDIAQVLEAGAHDAIVESTAGDELSARVRRWTRVAEEERALRERLANAEEQALRDELTGLGNRRSFTRALDYAVDYGSRYGGPLAVVLIDLDGFKRLNDAHGHPAGDAALCAVAEILKTTTRSTDHAARLGGDEFAIVMPQARAPEAAHVCERIRERVRALAAGVTASFGVASAEVVRGHADLFARADAALYEAKRLGKDRVVVDVKSRPAIESESQTAA